MHIRVEERKLFQDYQKKISNDELIEIGKILKEKSLLKCFLFQDRSFLNMNIPAPKTDINIAPPVIINEISDCGWLGSVRSSSIVILTESVAYRPLSSKTIIVTL